MVRIASSEIVRLPAFGAWLVTASHDSSRRAARAWNNDEKPDASYWTPYDCFMIEREARALRRASAVATIARLGRAFRRLASR
jgi:hypothetical protein